MAALGSQEYFKELILNHSLVRNWFPVDGEVINALAAAMADPAAFNFEQIRYVEDQTRLATATDAFLDLIAEEFIGKNRLLRRSGESDATYRARIKREILRARGTRKAISDALEELTGYKPRIVEPNNVRDTGNYGSLGSGQTHAVAYNVGPGCYGSRQRPYEFYVDVVRPAGVGNPGIIGYTNHVPDTDPPAPIPEPETFVICAGQSNALGFQLDQSVLPVHLQSPIANALIWDTPNAVWQTLRPGYNTGTASNPQCWGPESEFSYQWTLAHPGKKLYVVKSVKGSTPLALDPVGQDWNPASVGDLFDTCTNTVVAAKSNLANASVDYRVTNILWMQGEQDASVANYAPLYQTNFTNFIANARTRWGDGDNTSVTFGRIHLGTGFAYGSNVRAAQANVAATVSGVYMVDTDSYTMQGDNLHFSAADQVSLGGSMFALYPEPPPVVQPEWDDGFYPMPGGYGAGRAAYGSSKALNGSVSDDEIIRTINDTKAAGTTAIIKIERANSSPAPINYPPEWETPAGNLGSYNETSNVIIQLKAFDPNGDDVTYSVSNSSLPSGLNLNTNTGVLSGTLGNAIVDTTTVFNVKATDPGGKFATRQFSLVSVHLNTPPEFTTNSSLGNFVMGNAFTGAFAATDLEGDAITFSVDPQSALPNGLTLYSNGTVSGAFLGVGTQTFTLRATDTKGAYTPRTFTANVTLGPALYVGNTIINASGSNVLAKPAGTQVGDYMLVFNPYGGPSTITGGDGGWTAVTGTFSSYSYVMTCLHKRLTAGDIANTLTHNASSYGPTIALVYRGPIHAQLNAQNSAATGTTLTFASNGTVSNSAIGWVAWASDRDGSGNANAPIGWADRASSAQGTFTGEAADWLTTSLPTTANNVTMTNFAGGSDQAGFLMELVGPFNGTFYQPNVAAVTYENSAIIDMPGIGATIFDFNDQNTAFRCTGPDANTNVYGWEINVGDMANVGGGVIGGCTSTWFSDWTTNYPSSKPPQVNGAGAGIFNNTSKGAAYSYIANTTAYGQVSGTTANSITSMVPLSSQVIGCVVNLPKRKLNIFQNGVLKGSYTFDPAISGQIYPMVGSWLGQMQGSFRATKSTYWDFYYV